MCAASCNVPKERMDTRMSVEQKKIWQRLARFYGDFMKKSDKMYDEIANRTKPYLKKEMAVLELACGTGQMSYRLAKFVNRWEATDFSPQMIDEAKKKNNSEQLRFSVRDATDLHYSDEGFDAVMIANALHIMPNPDKALNEICRVLKSGGVLLAPTFVHSESRAYRRWSRLMELVGIRIYHKWTAEEFVRYIEGFGFTVEKFDVIMNGFIPLCCLIARRKRDTK